MFYEPQALRELSEGLAQVYALLKTAGDLSFTDHLLADRIDYCRFGNSNPFRVRIVNQLNDNYDYFYVKRADASRVYGTLPASPATISSATICSGPTSTRCALPKSL